MFENVSIDIPCGNCRHKIKKDFRWLEKHGNFTFTCTKCRNVNKVDSSEFRKQIAKARREM